MDRSSEPKRLGTPDLPRDQHQAVMARAERLAALREILVLVAHELHQPLASIAASGEAALRWLERDEPALIEACTSLRRILTHKDRAAEVIANVRQTLAGETAQSSCDFAAAARLAASKLSEGHSARMVEVEVIDPMADAALDPIEAELVFHHLLRNGLEALQDGGPSALKVRLSANGTWATAEVRDSGRGIAEEDRARVFDPFFTTKSGAEGFGLSIARSLVRGAGGRIELLDSGPAGTVFRVQIPLVQGKADEDGDIVPSERIRTIP